MVSLHIKGANLMKSGSEKYKERKVTQIGHAEAGRGSRYKKSEVFGNLEGRQRSKAHETWSERYKLKIS